MFCVHNYYVLKTTAIIAAKQQQQQHKNSTSPTFLLNLFWGFGPIHQSFTLRVTVESIGQVDQIVKQ